MTTSDDGPSAGWYPDPEKTDRLRYFDGNDWTDHYYQDGANLPATPESAAPKTAGAIWVESFTTKYADFDGRANRGEYWSFTLINLAIAIGLTIAGTLAEIVFLALLGFVLVALIPSLAAATRRLHDSGKSGLWLLIWFLPFGGLVLVVLMLLDSHPHENQYGRPR